MVATVQKLRLLDASVVCMRSALAAQSGVIEEALPYCLSCIIKPSL